MLVVTISTPKLQFARQLPAVPRTKKKPMNDYSFQLAPFQQQDPFINHPLWGAQLTQKQWTLLIYKVLVFLKETKNCPNHYFLESRYVLPSIFFQKYDTTKALLVLILPICVMLSKEHFCLRVVQMDVFGNQAKVPKQ